MKNLVVKTIGVFILTLIAIPVIVVLLSILPAVISAFVFPTNFYFRYILAMLILLSEVIAILYFVENYKK